LFFAIARRTAFGSVLMTSIKVRAAPDGRRADERREFALR
jgi:hypothetical protein